AQIEVTTGQLNLVLNNGREVGSEFLQRDERLAEGGLGVLRLSRADEQHAEVVQSPSQVAAAAGEVGEFGGELLVHVQRLPVGGLGLDRPATVRQQTAQAGIARTQAAAVVRRAGKVGR